MPAADLQSLHCAKFACATYRFGKAKILQCTCCAKFKLYKGHVSEVPRRQTKWLLPYLSCSLQLNLRLRLFKTENVLNQDKDQLRDLKPNIFWKCNWVSFVSVSRLGAYSPCFSKDKALNYLSLNSRNLDQFPKPVVSTLISLLQGENNPIFLVK